VVEVKKDIKGAIAMLADAADLIQIQAKRTTHTCRAARASQLATRSCTRAKAGRVSVRRLRQDLLPFFPETVLIHEFQTQIVDALEQAIPR
jgi:hypothetical protein